MHTKNLQLLRLTEYKNRQIILPPKVLLYVRLYTQNLGLLPLTNIEKFWKNQPFDPEYAPCIPYEGALLINS